MKGRSDVKLEIHQISKLSEQPQLSCLPNFMTNTIDAQG